MAKPAIDASSPSAEFARRSVLYSRCDARLCDHTRFFAAAAMVNAVLAKNFDVLPAVRAPHSFSFLSEVGAALEIDNLTYARQISFRPLGKTFDYALVRAEQGRLQEFVRVHQERRPQEWGATRRELNGLLNDRYAASLFSRWCESTGGLFRVLRKVREQVRMQLDFADETHRIRIGLELIEHIRRDAQCPRERARGYGLPAGSSSPLFV
jgi:hypothetical protein